MQIGTSSAAWCSLCEIEDVLLWRTQLASQQALHPAHQVGWRPASCVACEQCLWAWDIRLLHDRQDSYDYNHAREVV